MGKKNQDTEAHQKAMENLMMQRICKRPLWNGFKEAIGVFFLACFILLCVGAIILLIITLIENPVSLAILCVTILLIWIWRSR